MKKYIAVAAIIAPLIMTPAMAQSDLKSAIAADYDENLKSLFEHFHANPELSHREFETSKRLAAEISALGYDVTEGVGGTGGVAVRKNGDGPTVLIRADMDGLPVKEDNSLPYKSTATQEDIDGIIKPVMHACGHDTHITSLVGTARQMAARKDQWSGTLVLIGQPAEERISGARAMLEDGLYKRFPKPDYALAFHVSAGQPTGTVQVPLGIRASSSDSVDIIVHGVGAHGASPHKGVDPVLVASQIGKACARRRIHPACRRFSRSRRRARYPHPEASPRRFHAETRQGAPQRPCVRRTTIPCYRAALNLSLTGRRRIRQARAPR